MSKYEHLISNKDCNTDKYCMSTVLVYDGWTFSAFPYAHTKADKAAGHT